MTKTYQRDISDAKITCNRKQGLNVHFEKEIKRINLVAPTTTRLQHFSQREQTGWKIMFDTVHCGGLQVIKLILLSKVKHGGKQRESKPIQIFIVAESIDLINTHCQFRSQARDKTCEKYAGEAHALLS